MKTRTILNTLETAWVIALKDIQDVLRNKNGRCTPDTCLFININFEPFSVR